jgi:neuraminyllactose-binding hemagglutinin
MFTRVIVLLLVLAVGVLFIVGSAAKQKAPIQPPKFEFSPPTTASPNSAKVTFALVNAHYSQHERWTTVPPFNTFCQSLSTDFQEALAARGFTVRGPFDRYDEMTFPDKKNSDLVLQPDLDVSVSSTPRVVPLLVAKQLEADLIVRGRVTLSARESLTGERMWYKSIELDPVSLKCEGKTYPADAQVPSSEGTPAAMLANQECAQMVGPVMEKYYAKVMDATWKYLEPEEMAMVKKQAEEIRTRKVY